MAALLLLLVNVLAKGARPPARLFWTLPCANLTFATIDAACLLLALFAPSWWGPACHSRQNARL